MDVSQVHSDGPATLDDLGAAPSGGTAGAGNAGATGKTGETGEVGKVAETGSVGAAGGTEASRRAATGLRLRPGPRRRLPPRVDLGVAAALAVVGVAVVVAVDTRMTRPFWYDEVWRAHFVSEPVGTFWNELAAANVPSAFGWVGLTRLTGEVLGWHAAALRTPAALALPLLAVAGYFLARRFAGVVPAAFAGLALAVSGTIVDLGTQLKPYTVEALATVGIVALWSAGTASTRARLARRCAAGVVALFSVPAVFVIVPLAVADVVGARGRRAQVRAAAVAAPAVALAGLHSLLFVAHQTAQRGGRYWDTYFLAGRDPAEALRFIGAQLLGIASGAPPGIDGPDINLVHPATDGTAVSTWLIAPAVSIALVAGALRLARHPRRTAAARPWPRPRAAVRPGQPPTLPEADGDLGAPPAAQAPASRLTDGRLLLAALVGAQILQLAASAWRYWPFGPVRPNLFVVPLILVVVAAGADTLAHRLGRSLPRQRTQRAEEQAQQVRQAQSGPAVVEPAPAPAAVAEPVPGSVAGPVAADPASADPASADTTRIAASATSADSVASTPTAATEAVVEAVVERVAGPMADAGSADLARLATSAVPAPVPAPASAPATVARPRLPAAVPAVTAVATVAAVAVLAVLAAVPLAGASAMRPLWQAQGQLRSIELLVDATTVTREVYRPGDLVVVGGRLARPGWLYAMESSDDAPFVGDRERAVPGDRGAVPGDGDGDGGGNGRSGGDGGVSRSGGDGGTRVAGAGTAGSEPRVPREATVFLRAVGDAGVARAVATRPGNVRQVVFFVLDYDRRGTRQELGAMRAAGWCETRRWDFELTGTLHYLSRCDRPSS